MNEEIAPIYKTWAGLYEMWYFDGRREQKQLSSIQVYRLMNEPPEDLMGMNRLTTKNGEEPKWTKQIKSTK